MLSNMKKKKKKKNAQEAENNSPCREEMITSTIDK